MFIGKVEIKIPIILAPMAGVTDYPFRVLCKEWVQVLFTLNLSLQKV